MFGAPPSISTCIFSSLPEILRVKDRWTPLSEHLPHHFDSFLEGPSFDRRGDLYCVDIAFGRILRVGQNGAFEQVAEYDGEPNGLKIHRDGRLFVADRQMGLVLVDPTNGSVDRVLSKGFREPFRGPNDLVFSADGDLYFTDQGASDLIHPYGRVYRLRAGGMLELILDGLPGPNGIAISPDGRSLCVALTRPNQILRASLLPDGSVGRVQTFIQLSGGHGPDGIAFDQAGGLAVAHPGLGVVWLFNARGEPILRVDLCEGSFGTNIAYGGPDNNELYITESHTGKIHVVTMPAPGLPMYSHSDS